MKKSKIEKNKTIVNTEIPVMKTIKLFINGEFPRTESGRAFPVIDQKSKKHFAHLCQGSRKDFRNAVTAAKDASPSWQSRSAYNRGQILYRMAEMMQSKKDEFIAQLVDMLNLSTNEAKNSVEKSIDAFVYYAGFSDKYQQVMGAVNPVNGPHHNFTTAEAMGVVTLVLDNKKTNLETLVAQICAIIVSGNSVIVLLPLNCFGTILAPLAEVFATSDLPKGVINIITADIEELNEVISTHMEVQAISCQSYDQKILAQYKLNSAENMKRIIPPQKNIDDLSLENLMQYLEYKTVWHPIGV